jgi:threonylcarbamoyladenosine tRNA methylthiotransferase MtaB
MSGNPRQTTAAIINHGCKLNQFEGESLGTMLRERGVTLVDLDGNRPDIVIVNTCTVTARGDRKSRRSIMRAVKSVAPEGRVIVTGCYAETDRTVLEGMPGVDAVVGTGDKAAIPSMLLPRDGEIPDASPFSYVDPVIPFYPGEGTSPARSRAFLKVQDGCSMACSYCKVPLARGPSVSRNAGDVLESARRIVESGFREVVMTGINLGSYRSGELSLADLLEAIVRRCPSLRIRLSSIEPVFFTPRLLDAVGRLTPVVPHFHLPLQSGSDRILSLMKRPYGREDFRALVAGLRRLRPDAHIAVDVIVGFPTEGEEDFQETRRLVEEIAPASLHVFRYSRRQGTAAETLGDPVPSDTKARRSRTLIEMSDRLNERYRMSFLGSVRPAILENRSSGPTCVTDNYIGVRVEGVPEPLSPRDLVKVRLDRLEGHETRGVIVR